ncbi:MAG TPA: SagB/ThcOx family dehydrogenase, partial [Atribacteraceae bacterium]|nr:SagB/ThcOx family dehydrogenase [Atribacteraceae bacterium]
MVSNLKKTVAVAAILVVALAGAMTMNWLAPAEQGENSPIEAIVSLPPPSHTGELSVEEAIFRRRSIRRFTEEPMTLPEVSQLLWSAGGKTIDGVTGATRAFPSAGGLYPFEIYLVAGNVTDLPDGVYRFDWREHSLELIREGDFREELMVASLRQRFVHQAPVNIVWVGDLAKIQRR